MHQDRAGKLWCKNRQNRICMRDSWNGRTYPESVDITYKEGVAGSNLASPTMKTQSFAGKIQSKKRGRSRNKNYKPPLIQEDGASLEMIGFSVTLPTGRSGTITAGLGRATGKLRRKRGIASARILTPVDLGGISLKNMLLQRHFSSGAGDAQGNPLLRAELDQTLDTHDHRVREPVLPTDYPGRAL